MDNNRFIIFFFEKKCSTFHYFFVAETTTTTNSDGSTSSSTSTVLHSHPFLELTKTLIPLPDVSGIKLQINPTGDSPLCFPFNFQLPSMLYPSSNDRCDPGVFYRLEVASSSKSSSLPTRRTIQVGGNIPDSPTSGLKVIKSQSPFIGDDGSVTLSLLFGSSAVVRGSTVGVQLTIDNSTNQSLKKFDFVFSREVSASLPLVCGPKSTVCTSTELLVPVDASPGFRDLTGSNQSRCALTVVVHVESKLRINPFFDIEEFVVLAGLPGVQQVHQLKDGAIDYDDAYPIKPSAPPLDSEGKMYKCSGLSHKEQFHSSFGSPMMSSYAQVAIPNLFFCSRESTIVVCVEVLFVTHALPKLC